MFSKSLISQLNGLIIKPFSHANSHFLAQLINYFRQCFIKKQYQHVTYRKRNAKRNLMMNTCFILLRSINKYSCQDDDYNNIKNRHPTKIWHPLLRCSSFVLKLQGNLLWFVKNVQNNLEYDIKREANKRTVTLQ